MLKTRHRRRGHSFSIQQTVQAAAATEEEEERNEKRGPVERHISRCSGFNFLSSTQLLYLMDLVDDPWWTTGRCLSDIDLPIFCVHLVLVV